MNSSKLTWRFANQETDFLQGADNINLTQREELSMNMIVPVCTVDRQPDNSMLLNLLTDYLHIHFVTEFEFIRF